MNDRGNQPPGAARLWLRNNVLGLLAIFIAFSGTAVAAQVASDTSPATTAAKKKKKVKRGPPGPQGPPGPSTGPAGGALTGTFPNPSLAVSGGPCPNGQELVNVSALAALSCSAGVYSDGLNVAAGPTSFPALTTGSQNTAVGADALVDVTDGIRNSAVGEFALDSNTGGLRNTALGYSALAGNVTGVNNTAVGEQALGGNGSDNTAVGRFALAFNFVGNGSDSTAVGNNALAANTSGFQNAALGDDALDSNTDGDGNTAIGQGALAAATTANGNTALGENAGDALTTGSNNIAIENPGVAAEAGTTRIGTNGTHTRAFVAGIRGTTTGVADAVPVLIDSAGQLGTASSSRDVKTGIDPLGAIPRLMKLRPVSFRYRSGPPELRYGLIAEQVAKVMPQLAVYDEDGLPETVQYQDLPVLLLARIQAQQRQLKHQQAQIDALMRQGRGD